MRTIVINEDKYDAVRDTDLTACKIQTFNGEVVGLVGTLSIDIYGRGWIDYTGEHGPHDFAIDYGFIIDLEANQC